MTVAILILAAGESRRFYGRETGTVGGGNLPPTAVMKPAGGLGEQSCGHECHTARHIAREG